MRRLFVPVLLASSIARADTTLPVDNVRGGQPDDWALYAVELRDEATGAWVGETKVNGKAVPLRAVIKVERGRGKARVAAWYVGPQDAEVAHWSQSFEQALDSRIIPSSTAALAVKTEAATCKLDDSFACSKVTFMMPELVVTTPKLAFQKARAGKVTLTMAKRIKGAGIVDLAIEAKGGAMRMKVIGYGHAGKSEWGAPASKATLTGTYANAAEPTLALEHLETRGTLETAQVRKVLDASAKKLLYCFEKSVLADPALQPGKVELQLMIELDGTVSSARAKGVSKAVEQCVSEASRGLGFPRSGSATLVELDLQYAY